jgi:aldehyde oxidoreductase
LIINGASISVIADDASSLASVLRDQLLLTGTKVGCNAGQCGACNVIMDGKLVRSCTTKMSKVPDGASIITIEGIGD